MDKYFLPLLWLEIILFALLTFLFNFTEEMVILGLDTQRAESTTTMAGKHGNRQAWHLEQ